MVSVAVGNEESVRRLVGLADCFELLKSMFAFPEEALVDGIVSGSVAQDMVTCLEDAGANESEVARARSCFADVDCSDGEALYALMRQTHSQWYLAPGSKVPIFPYESAFRFVSSGQKGTPSLFRTPVALEVKKSMAEAGVVPVDAAREPVDSIWNELSFLAFLFGSWASATFEGNDEGSERWEQRCHCFWDAHGRVWIPEFMAATQRLADESKARGPYGAFADFGLVATDVTSRFLGEGLR